MSLDAGDRARLRRIETELAATDPALVRRFRRWRPSSGPEPLGPGWSVVPAWTLVVFLVGCTTWMVAPAVGATIAVLACCRAAWRRARNGRGRHVDELWGRDGRPRQGTS